MEAETDPADFCIRKFFGRGVPFSATPLIVPLSLSHSDITRFLPLSPIATGNYLDRANKFPSFAQTTGTTDAFNSP